MTTASARKPSSHAVQAAGLHLVAAEALLRGLKSEIRREGGDRDQALRLFMRLAGSSDDDIAGAEAAPVWPALVTLAPTLRYDAACLGDGLPPAERLETVTQPVLLTSGATTDPHSAGLPIDFFGAAADTAAAHLENGRRVTIEVAGHVPDPALIGPVLATFYRD